MTPKITALASIFLFITVASCQTCDNFQYAFDWGTEITAPLDTITFDNLGSSVPWTSQYGTALRITPATSMEVTLTGVNDGANYVRVMPGLTPLSSDWSTNWNKTDNYMGYYAWRNVGTITFAQPIRQFSMMLAHDNACIALGWTPYIGLLNSTGGVIGASPLDATPAQGSVNQYFILRYRNSCPIVYGIVLGGCAFVMDNLSLKTEPCSPNLCNVTTENCIDTGLDAVCCPKNTTWNGVRCMTGNACLDTDNPCDPLATCSPLRTGGFKCTCPPKYIGIGTPGNCTLLESAPSNVTYNISPILECIDENNVAQFGYNSLERSTLLIDDPLRNNLEPINTAPVMIFSYGRSRRYPLNPGQVLLNVTSDHYVWRLENHNLSFAIETSRVCPTHISILFQFSVSGSVNPTQFAEQTRLSFITVTNVVASRVAIVNVNETTLGNKRSAAQQDVTQLEIELSVAPPENASQPSSAEVIRQFDPKQDDFLYELYQAYPNQTISASLVSTQAAPPPQAPTNTNVPSSEPSFIASNANSLTHLCCALMLVLLSLL